MIYCFLNPDKLTNFRFRRPKRKRLQFTTQSIEEMLIDPAFKAYMKLRMRMRELSKNIENIDNE